MPNKTIYVAEGDLTLFQRAQELAGGNLSSAIARALRRFVETEEARMEGYEEITVVVGGSGNRRFKRFRGRQVAQWLHQDSTGEDAVGYTVYRTQQGRYAVHVRTGAAQASWWGLPAPPPPAPPHPPHPGPHFGPPSPPRPPDPPSWPHRPGMPGGNPWTGPAQMWSQWAADLGRWVGQFPRHQWQPAQAWWDAAEYRLDVYDDLDQLRENLPSEVVDLVEGNERETPVEELDI